MSWYSHENMLLLSLVGSLGRVSFMYSADRATNIPSRFVMPNSVQRSSRPAVQQAILIIHHDQKIVSL